MPFINTKINTKLTKEQRDTLKTKLGQAITTIPGKSEAWLMVAFEENIPLYFKGSDEGTIAFIEVKVFGKASPSIFNTLTGKICSIYSEVLGMDPSKIYVKYEEVENWGWNGSNF